MPFVFSQDELTGRARTHIVDLDAPRCSLHAAVVQPLLAMRAAAAGQGIDLVPFSSFRDFDRQLSIWNAKARGERISGFGHRVHTADPRTARLFILAEEAGLSVSSQRPDAPAPPRPTHQTWPAGTRT